MCVCVRADNKALTNIRYQSNGVSMAIAVPARESVTSSNHTRAHTHMYMYMYIYTQYRLYIIMHA